MKKQIIPIILGILLIGIASAVTYNISAGDTVSFDIGQVYDHYSITGNSTELNLNISQEGTIVTIIIDKYSLPDTFDITFFNIKNEVIYQYNGGGGGVAFLSGTPGETAPIKNLANKPSNSNNTPITTNNPSPITGSVIGNFIKSGTGIVTVIFLIVVIASGIGLALRKRK